MNAGKLLIALVAAAAAWSLAAGADLASGATLTWVGDDFGSDWGSWDTTKTNSNWLSGSTYSSWTNGSDALFTTAVYYDVLVDGAVTVHKMTFNVDGYTVYSDTDGSGNYYPVNLSGAAPTISVASGATVYMYALLTGTTGMNKAGSGVAELDLPNTYSGGTTVSAGVLRLADPNALPGGTGTSGGTGNLTLAGGVLELAAGDFTRPLGTGAGQVQFTASGGFSALWGDRIVNFGGASIPVTWGPGSSFLPTGSALLLGSASDDSLVDFQNPINLGAAIRTVQVTTSGYAVLDARLSGVLSGSGGGLNVTGNGTLELTAANTYSGGTTVGGGVLRLSNSAALPGGNLTLTGGGVLELAAGDFTRALGTSAGQVQFTGAGGFSASGANRVVNLGGASAQVTWGPGSSFLPNGSALLLGSASDDSMVDFQNPINLGAAIRTVQVTTSGYALLDARLSGALSGSGGGLNVTGNGTLELTAANTYSGGTTIAGGVLRLSNSAALPGGNLTLAGSGVVELAAGDFTRALGTSAGQVQLTGAGGFSASGANRVVNLGGVSAQVTWGANSFLPAASSLLLGSASDDSMVDFQNPINLGAAIRTVQVTASGYAILDARLSGVLSGSGGGLNVTGNGALELTAANTYSGGTTIAGGVLRLSNSAALPGGNLTLAGGVVELAAGDFTRALGTSAGQVQFSGAGGFSASGANRVVNLGGASAQVTWAANGFLPDGSTLLLGSASDDSMVDFQNPINLGAAIRTVQVTTSGYAVLDARLSGVLSGSGGGLNVTGNGALELTATNTYSGGTTVGGGVLR
ncbi:MAG: autotransporter-associated beta strand repeat-containing protein, partial [Thermoguttaceae bacterium]